MATLQLDIVTPSASVFSGPVSEVVLPAWEGQMGVFPQHDALLALLRAGVCKVSGADGTHTFVVGRAWAQVLLASRSHAVPSWLPPPDFSIGPSAPNSPLLTLGFCFTDSKAPYHTW